MLGRLRATVTDTGRRAVMEVAGERLVGFEGFRARWRAETFPDGRDTLRGL